MCTCIYMLMCMPGDRNMHQKQSACRSVRALMFLCDSVSRCVCVSMSLCEQPKHFDIPMSMSSGAKSVGGSDQTHAGSLQALTLLFSIHLSLLPSFLFSPLLCLSSFSSPALLYSFLPHVHLSVYLFCFSSSFLLVFHSLCLALLSITLCFHHILSFHVDGGCS